VINADDPRGRALADSLKGKQVLRFSKQAGADIAALSFESKRAGIAAEVQTPLGILNVTSPLLGEHNLENLLLAIGCGVALGLSADTIVAALRKAQGAPGRLERVESPDDVLVFVDYAHTDDALRRVLSAARKITSGRLIALFGAGGDRDPGKRPLMGKAAAELSDLVVITSDNPRSESPEKIVEMVEAGTRGAGMPKLTAAELAGAQRGYLTEVDRRAAIRLAIESARPGDTVVLAGKGHEKYQIIGSDRHPFDDVVEARTVLGSRVGGG
jgi:UDP-N-acetylmuramoyl-L-alanyl-D-glutamate--2,6-diaminopimelate ligase